MKVRASVKKMCRNCKIVRRRGVLRVICSRGAAAQAAPRLEAVERPSEESKNRDKSSMARIAGINLPDNKHAGIVPHLHLYGVGRSRAQVPVRRPPG